MSKYATGLSSYLQSFNPQSRLQLPIMEDYGTTDREFELAMNEDAANSAGLSYGDNTYKGAAMFDDTPSPGFSLDRSMDWMTKNAKGIGAAAKLGGLAMQGYSTFFGQGKELHDAKMKAYGISNANDQAQLDNKLAVRDAWKNTDGLASSATKVG